MYNSISYVEIRCKYNKSDLKRFVGAIQNRDANRLIVYRNRKYFVVYDSASDSFYIRNRNNINIAHICDVTFYFYASSAPEIGLDLVWGLIALLNIYPVKA